MFDVTRQNVATSRIGKHEQRWEDKRRKTLHSCCLLALEWAIELMLSFLDPVCQ